MLKLAEALKKWQEKETRKREEELLEQSKRHIARIRGKTPAEAAVPLPNTLLGKHLPPAADRWGGWWGHDDGGEEAPENSQEPIFLHHHEHRQTPRPDGEDGEEFEDALSQM